MGRPRAFDWDEAARLYAECRSYAEVGRRLGVAGQSVRQALSPSARRRAAAKQRRDQPWKKPCLGGCGRMATAQGSRTGLCMTCSALARSKTVRADTLRCSCCRLWLPDEDFPHRNSCVSRRKRHPVCTACGRVMKRDWRAANQERERAKDRKRKRRIRAVR